MPARPSPYPPFSRTLSVSFLPPEVRNPSLRLTQWGPFCELMPGSQAPKGALTPPSGDTNLRSSRKAAGASVPAPPADAGVAPSHGTDNGTFVLAATARTDEGIRAAAALRHSRPEIGVVVLSQFLEPEYAVALLEKGAAGRRLPPDEQVQEREPGCRCGHVERSPVATSRNSPGRQRPQITPSVRYHRRALLLARNQATRGHFHRADVRR